MKIPIFILLSILFVNLVFAQDTKLFLDKNEQVVDSTKASSYMMITAKSDADSVYRVRQFSFENLLILSGSFKDQTLSIPHGEYSYYQILREIGKGSFSKANNYTDTVYRKPEEHFLDARGSFFDGKMNGEWLHFFKNGTIKRVENFNKEILVGKYKEYLQDGTVLLEGNYDNGQREGLWLERDGLNKLIYLNGKVISRKVDKDKEKQIKEERQKLVKNEKDYLIAMPIGDFRSDLKRFMQEEGKIGIIGEEAKVSFIVKEDGSISTPVVIGISNHILAEKIKSFFLQNDKWKPAKSGKDKIPVISRVVYTIRYL